MGVAVDEGASTPVTFDDFVVARGNALWRAAWLLTGDAALAEDLVQSALAKSYRAWNRVGPQGFEAYVRRVVFTTYLGWRKRRSFHEHPTERLPEQPDPPPDVEQRRDLVAALGDLTKGQRAVIVLRYLEDLTEQQTADVLGVSVGTVKSQASRALTALRASTRLGETHD